MKAVTLQTLKDLKARNERFSSLTCYDASFAAAMARAEVEVILIGDSLGMVLQGHDSTLPVTVDDMAYHTAAVARTNKTALIMADLPFMTYATLPDALANAATLMRAGAHMVKLEGGAWLAETVAQLARGGIPTCVHLGLTPQSVNVFGGYRVQGRGDAGERLLADARAVVEAGAAVLLLECVPTDLARRLHAECPVPVIGIGAGPDCDGQVLVMHDMLGLHNGKPARFVKNYLGSGDGSIEAAFRQYVAEVKDGRYPAPEHAFA
ncbi:3-methyl-2-oxobutanoate hydroxymethyltransferase [Amnimonas aquatica]|uniref:3-methyl-2-oxobutanoate hydroxymethyltransferase n=1 Tax=Amnimonas aquatica TaxID=2094561 RepID=A0A2P6AVH8_9GAMM|nr:3-methyl-2-oxobutanoate hydroxymethyltransferase [Amnimonas aquatica]PQA52334.1 3-methyl-2-oxobutanoate hydroxymethyltransferase [Amnimonas aquatica]